MNSASYVAATLRDLQIASSDGPTTMDPYLPFVGNTPRKGTMNRTIFVARSLARLRRGYSPYGVGAEGDDFTQGPVTTPAAAQASDGGGGILSDVSDFFFGPSDSAQAAVHVTPLDSDLGISSAIAAIDPIAQAAAQAADPSSPGPSFSPSVSPVAPSPSSLPPIAPASSSSKSNVLKLGLVAAGVVALGYAATRKK